MDDLKSQYSPLTSHQLSNSPTHQLTSSPPYKNKKAPELSKPGLFEDFL